MRIAVLAGGVSRERDVSLLSGTMIARALRSAGNEVALIDSFVGVPQDVPDGTLFTRDNAEPIPSISEHLPDIEALRRTRTGSGDIGPGVVDVLRKADITFNALHGGDGENGKLQAYLDLQGIRYTGDGYFASALAMHKDVAKLLFERAGVPVPNGTVYRSGRDSVTWTGSYPAVVKPCAAGSSVGVAFAANDDELRQAVEAAFEFDDGVLVEDRIAGREFAVGVLGGHALPVVEILPSDGSRYDYAHKYQAGRTEETCPADIPDETTRHLQDLAERACRALGIEILARGEFIIGPDGVPRCLEMNTVPGMTPTSLLPQEAGAAGMSFEALCTRIVDLSMKKHD